jgi:O-antigen ligase
VIVRWITRGRGHGIGANLALAIVVLGSVASGMRINFLVAGLSILAGYGWVLLKRPSVQAVLRMGVVLAMLGVVGVLFRDKLIDRFQSVGLEETVDVSTGQVFTDPSAASRFLEGLLVVRELETHRRAILLGKGFGGTYENFDNLIPHYPQRQHHAHNSVLTILLRNGLVGVIAIFSIPLVLVFDMLRKDRERFVAAHGLLMTYVALMTDQYLYWGLLYGLSFALWWHARRAPAAVSVA